MNGVDIDRVHNPGRGRGNHKPRSDSLRQKLREWFEGNPAELLTLDDILIVNGSSTSTDNPTIDDIRFVSYPNPVENWLNLLFRLRSTDRISVQLRDINGKLLLQTPTQQLSPGEQQIHLDLSQLPTGAYTITLQTSTQTHTNLILRK